MAGWNHANAKWATKLCGVCSTEFTPKSGAHKFCSEQCKGKWKYISGAMTTESQYRSISGNWRRYYIRLLQAKTRKVDGLTIEHLLRLHEQQKGLCALTKSLMTCELHNGEVCYTNASIDRIDAGGPYSPDNVQLVCRHVNSWRGIMPLDTFVAVCRAVVAAHDGE